MIILSVTSYAQIQKILDKSPIIPIADMKLNGLVGGVKDGKWIRDSETATLMSQRSEFILIGENGVEEGGVTVGNKLEPDVPCEAFQPLKFDLETDSGIAVGSEAKWNLTPRKPQKLENDSRIYNKIIKSFLFKKGLPKAVVKIRQIYQIDLEGDGRDEIVISATSYKDGVSSTARVGDYSFVLLRKISGKNVKEILLSGELVEKNIEFGAPNDYQISAIADLNGDGKMEIVVFGQYYEGSFSSVFEIDGDKTKSVLSSGCGV